jgi:hypothetical protein
MPYKAMPDIITCTNVAEAVGRLYCASKGKAWPEAPDFYGPGRQPQPPAAFYQRYWQAPLAASGPTPQDPTAPVLPIRIQVDSVAQAFNGQQVITSGGPVTIDFTALTADPVATGQAVGP